MRRLLLGLALLAAPAQARDSLGIWNDWGAFRDPGVPRCYAIAMAHASSGRANETQPYLSIGIWPKRGVRGEVHVHLSRRLSANAPVTMTIGSERFTLIAGAGDAWAQDKRMDAAIIAAMRSASDIAISGRAGNGRGFRDLYHLDGAASAMDAAALGCAQN
jgi:hypothetical protein